MVFSESSTLATSDTILLKALNYVPDAHHESCRYGLANAGQLHTHKHSIEQYSYPQDSNINQNTLRTRSVVAVQIVMASVFRRRYIVVVEYFDETFLMIPIRVDPTPH